MLKTEATKCESIATSLKAVRVSHWTGPAADGFERAMATEPKLWTTLSDQFATSFRALDAHGGCITAAQATAADAVATWAAGTTATRTAVAAYDKQVADYNSSLSAPAPVGVPSMGPARPGPFVDPGQPLRDEAERLLKQARDSVEKSGAAAIAALGGMPGAKTSCSTTGPGASGTAEGPKLSWGSDGEFGSDPRKGRNGKYDDGVPDAGPFSLSLGKLTGDAHLWQAKGSVEDYWGNAKVHADGEVDLAGADGSAGAVLDKNGLNVKVDGGVYLAKATGEAGGEWGYAQGKVDGEASLGADAEGNVVVTRTSAHAGGELFAGAKAEVGGEGDVGGVGGKVKAEGWAGIGASGDADIGYHHGTLRIGGSGGAALGLGGKLSGSVEIDVPRVVHTLGDAADAVGGLFD